jgi:hypothetical protein
MTAVRRSRYFTDAAGYERHVYDVAHVDGRIRQRDLGDPFATQRVFVARANTSQPMRRARH